MAQFAKKTGDFAAISKTDLRLIALTHMLELELNGKKYLNDIANKVEMPSLTSQLQKIQTAPTTTDDTTNSLSATTVTSTKAPVSAPKMWSNKSWATVLSDDGSPSTTTAADTAAVSDPNTEPVEQSEEIVNTESNVVVEEEEEGESESEDEQESESECEADEGEVDELATTLEEDCNILEQQQEEEEEHIVSGFAEDCGCSAENKHTEHQHTPSTTTTTTAPTTATTTSTAEPYHSRMMRPSGLASGNNAESQRLRLEDNGIGWVNSSNLIQQRGKNGYSFSTNALKQPKGNKTNQSTTNNNNNNNTDITTPNTDIPTTDTPTTTTTTDATTTIKKKSKKPKKRPTKVACLTTDFSMQNVMLQMDLRIMSVDGLMIKTAKQWVLRCIGCTTIHYDLDRLFCRKCGGHSLSRVSASVDSGGKLKLHLKKNYTVDLKGSKYSLPAPGKQGRYQGELLLREDQLLQGIWKQKCVKIRKDIKSAFGEDVTSDVGIHINKGQAIKIGMGKQNVNAKKGRERRGKSKSNTAK